MKNIKLTNLTSLNHKQKKLILRAMFREGMANGFDKASWKLFNKLSNSL